MLIRHIAIVPESGGLDTSELSKVAAAIQVQIARDIAPIWEAWATVDAFPRLEDVPVGYWPVVLSAEELGRAEGIHMGEAGQPYGRVQLRRHWSLAASRVCIDMLVNPNGARTVATMRPNHSRSPVEAMIEPTSACGGAGNAYAVNGVVVSDFCTPAFYDSQAGLTARSDVQYSLTGALKMPMSPLPGGYVSWYDPISGHHWIHSRLAEEAVTTRLDLAIAPGGSIRDVIRAFAPLQCGSRLALPSRVDADSSDAELGAQLKAHRLRLMLDGRTPLILESSLLGERDGDRESQGPTSHASSVSSAPHAKGVFTGRAGAAFAPAAPADTTAAVPPDAAAPAPVNTTAAAPIEATASALGDTAGARQAVPGDAESAMYEVSDAELEVVDTAALTTASTTATVAEPEPPTPATTPPASEASGPSAPPALRAVTPPPKAAATPAHAQPGPALPAANSGSDAPNPWLGRFAAAAAVAAMLVLGVIAFRNSQNAREARSQPVAPSNLTPSEIGVTETDVAAATMACQEGDTGCSEVSAAPSADEQAEDNAAADSDGASMEGPAGSATPDTTVPEQDTVAAQAEPAVQAKPAAPRTKPAAPKAKLATRKRTPTTRAKTRPVATTKSNVKPNVTETGPDAADTASNDASASAPALPELPQQDATTGPWTDSQGLEDLIQTRH